MQHECMGVWHSLSAGMAKCGTAGQYAGYFAGKIGVGVSKAHNYRSYVYGQKLNIDVKYCVVK
jgi:hypothetical protein